MADPTDWVKAGQVQNNAVDQGLQGQMQGVQIASAYQQHQQQLEDHQAKMAQFKEQQASWAGDQIGNILSIQNPQMRDFKFKQFQKTAGVAGVQVDPALGALMKDSDFAANAQQAYASLNNLPYDKRTSALMDMQGMLGDAASMEKNVLGHVGTLQTQRQQYASQLQMSQQQVAREQAVGQEKIVRENQAQLYTDNKDRFEQMHFANQILDNVEDPKLWNDPNANAAVKSGLAKALFPGGVIRESEVTFLNHISPGMGNQLVGWAKGKAGMGDLTPKQLQGIAQLAQRLGDSASNDFQKQIAAKAPYLKQVGVDPSAVASVAPEWKQRDLSQVFPGLRQSGTSPSARSTAQGAPVATPGKGFASLPPEKQSDLQAHAAQLGIKLDPAAPDFVQQLQTYANKLGGGGGQVTEPIEAQVLRQYPNMTPGERADKVAYIKSRQQAVRDADKQAADAQAKEEQYTQRERSGGSFNQ